MKEEQINTSFYRYSFSFFIHFTLKQFPTFLNPALYFKIYKIYSIRSTLCHFQINYGTFFMIVSLSFHCWRSSLYLSFLCWSAPRNTLIIIPWMLPWATWYFPWSMMSLGIKSICAWCFGTVIFIFDLFSSPFVPFVPSWATFFTLVLVFQSYFFLCFSLMVPLLTLNVQQSS